MKHFFSVVLLLLIGLGQAQAQGKAALLQQRKKLADDIQSVEVLLERIRKNKASTLDEYEALRAAVRKRRALVSNYRAEIATMTMELQTQEHRINALSGELKRYQADYAKMLRYAYRHQLSSERLLFLLSADDFNEARHRWQYFVRYDKRRKVQMARIESLQVRLRQERTALAERETAQRAALIVLEEEERKLARAAREQEALLKKLQAKEKDLAADLQRKQAARERLTQAIELAIREEMQARRASSRQRKPVASGGKERPVGIDDLTEADKRIAKAFRAQKGKLPMPVSGVITLPYGENLHPGQPYIRQPNRGIDIRTTEGALVKVVHDGVVQALFRQDEDGGQVGIMVRHGHYYTIYTPVEGVRVAKGQAVKAGTVLGRAVAKPREGAKLHFELWERKANYNPEHWLK